MERSRIQILLLAMAAIFILCSLTFASILAGIILAVPLIISNFAAFSFMVHRGIGLDINTLPVAALGIGLGVDYGIYLLGRMKEEYAECGDLPTTLYRALSTAGNGVIFAALTFSIPLMLWRLLADFKFQAEMGLQLGVLMICNALGALIFQPAVVYALKPRFILKRFPGKEK